MLRRVLLVGLFVLSNQVVLAQKSSDISFGRQHLFFPEANVAVQYHCPGKTQISWSLESSDRKLLSGASKVRDDIALVEFETPPLKDGITLELKLVIDGKSQPLFLVSRNMFANQHDWFGDLNIILLEDKDNDVSDILKDAEIPFTTTVDETTSGALILVTRLEPSYADYDLARQGNFVVIVAPEKPDMAVPQTTGGRDTDHTFLLTNDENMIFTHQQSKNRIPCLFPSIESFFLLGCKENHVALQMILLTKY